MEEFFSQQNLGLLLEVVGLEISNTTPMQNQGLDSYFHVKLYLYRNH